MLRRLSFQKRLFISLSIIIIILVILLSSAFYTYSSNTLLATESKSSIQIAQKISSQIDVLYKQMDIAAANTVNNEEIQNIIYKLSFDTTFIDEDMVVYDSNVRKILQQIYTYMPKATKTAVFNSRRHFYFYVGLYDDNAEKVWNKIHNVPWYESLIEPGKNMSIVPPHLNDWSDKKKVIISLYRKFVNITNKDYGIFEIQLPYSELEDICKVQSSNAETQSIIYDKNGKLIYPFDQSGSDLESFMPKTIFNKTISRAEGSGQLKGEKGYLLYSFYKSDYTGWNIILVSKENVLIKQMVFYRNSTIIFASSILVVILITFFILTRRMTRPLKKLIETVNGVNLENLNLHVPHEGSDEFKILNESFESMFTNLKDSINKLYESKIKEANAHFLALQAQINPHFLFNTLAAVSAAGEQYDSKVTTLMCNQLADMLRYTTSSNNPVVALKDEIAHVTNYLELMKVPYEGCLNYEILVDNEMLSIYVPKLILQPLVENCINHGFESVLPPWHITVTGSLQEEEKHWEITIEDNGSGFQTSVLSNINLQLAEYATNLSEGNFKENLAIGGMGILNIFARIAIHSGNDCTFLIENISPRGSKITIRGKIHKKGETSK